MVEKAKLHKLIIDDEVYETRLTRKYRERKRYEPTDPRKILAVIPGVVLSIAAKAGRRVKRGDGLMVIEAMKMKNDVFAPIDGRIKTIHVHEGEITSKNQLLIELE